MTVPSRRSFILKAAAMTAGSLFLPSRFARASASDGAPSVKPLARRGEDLLDEALQHLAATGPEFGGGLSNHGPMATEALVALGRSEAVIPWVDRYRKRLDAHPSTRDRILEDAWRETLGRYDRVGDWIAFFEAALKDAPWTGVLDTWAPRLAPGLAGVAMHGLIRTGHAARSLSQRDSALRRHELAEGLGYWAARYTALPETRGRTAARKLPSKIAATIPALPAGKRAPRGLIVDSLRALAGFEPFEAVADLADVSGDASTLVSDLTSTFAGAYLREARSSGRIIAFIHTVTGPSAIRLILPHVKSESRPDLLRYAWQAAAAVDSALGDPSGAIPAGDAQPIARDADDLADRAIATGDEHAIKFSEACLRENALKPDPIYMRAASDAVRRLA